jgi:pimeloyl-ACP methyl ester carboxylesterase
LAKLFTAEGLAVAIFNFRGCGDSGGNFDMMGWSRDLGAVLDKVLNTMFIDPTRVMLLGFSGGGAAAIHVAADNPDVYSLAVVGTPAHFEIFEEEPESIIANFRKRGIIRDADFPPDLNRWLEGFREIEPRKWISYFKGKHLLIVHGDADELIPVEHAHELFERAPSGISKLSIIAGGVHRLRLDPRCTEILKDWFLETLGWRK